MDKLRMIPPDPMEAAQTPIEGVDVPPETTGQPADRKAEQYVENEGLDPTPEQPRKDIERGNPADETAAAQRGRTA